MKFFIASGGTGGHIFPAESVAAELVARGHEVIFITDHRYKNYEGTEKKFKIVKISSATPKGGLASKIKAILAILKGIKEAKNILRASRDAVVIGFGGYPSFPAVVAATLLRMKIIIHEQNSVLGQANQVLVWCADLIATSFDNVGHISVALKSRVRKTGNPVRPSIEAIMNQPYPDTASGLNILITGGSLGAKIFADIIPETIKYLPEGNRNNIRIAQQVRKEEIDEVKKIYAGINFPAEVGIFFTDMDIKLKNAHLVITRAGASTVAELGIAGRPALFVPYPNSKGDHQLYNAESLEKIGGSWILEQGSFTRENLSAFLNKVISEPQILKNAAQAVKTKAQPGAAKKLADLAEALAEKGARKLLKESL